MTIVLTFHVVRLFTGQVYRTVAVRLVCSKSWSSGCDRLIHCLQNRRRLLTLPQNVTIFETRIMRSGVHRLRYRNEFV
jgi:hypothetical protein